LRDRYEDFKKKNCEIVVVSTTGVDASKYIAEELKLAYPFLSDPDWTVFKGYGTGAALGVPLPAQFLIDGTGRVVERILSDFLPKHLDLDETLAKITT
jgi:peroxiredoxin